MGISGLGIKSLLIATYFGTVIRWCSCYHVETIARLKVNCTTWCLILDSHKNSYIVKMTTMIN